jgi:hypothetical protein
MNDIIFYSAHTREFEGSVKNKIRAILEQNAIEYDKNAKLFYCKPIMQKDGKPYNSTTYELKKDKELFTCNCQGFKTSLRDSKTDPGKTPHCAHVAALYEYLKRGHIARREEKVSQAMLTLFGNE